MARRSPLEKTSAEMIARCRGGFRCEFHQRGWLDSRWPLIVELPADERNDVLFAWAHAGPDVYTKKQVGARS